MVLLPKLPEVGALPKGWPPLGPTLSTHSKIYSGKVLSFQELEQLRTDATLAAEMEVNDPDFKRATARYRAQCAEEDRIVDTQRAIEERSKAVEGVRTRIKMQQQAAKAYGSQKRERKAQRIKEAMAARDEKRNALVERITTNDRRQLVRDTIQKALVAQRYAENVSGAARVTSFSDGAGRDAPGPGAYSVHAPSSAVGAAFGQPPAKVAKSQQAQPGPGAYDPKLVDRNAAPSITMGGLHVESRRKRTEVQEMPGPGAYKVAQPTRKGGTISQHVVKTEMDFALERAAEQPGPGEYELTSLASGKSSTMTGRTRGAADIMLSQAARRCQIPTASEITVVVPHSPRAARLAVGPP